MTSPTNEIQQQAKFDFVVCGNVIQRSKRSSYLSWLPIDRACHLLLRTLKYKVVYNILQKYVHNSCSLCVEHIHASRFRFQIRFIIKVRNQNWQLRIFIISRYFLFVQTVFLSDWFNRSVLIYFIFPDWPGYLLSSDIIRWKN